jgi:hypothetical protein
VVERRARRDLLDRQDPRSAIGDTERRADVAGALAALPRRQREVAVYHYRSRRRFRATVVTHAGSEPMS